MASRTDPRTETPNAPAARFLAPVEIDLGFSPDNVEWQFPKVKRRTMRAHRERAAAIPAPLQTPRPTKAERKAARKAEEMAAKEAKREAIAHEFARWERLRNSG